MYASAPARSVSGSRMLSLRSIRRSSRSRVATGSSTATTSSLPLATSARETSPSTRVESEVRTPRGRGRPRSGSGRSRSCRPAGARPACRVVDPHRGRSPGRRASRRRGSSSDLTRQQRVEGASTRHGGAGAGDGEPDRALACVTLQRKGLDEPDCRDGGRDERERHEDHDEPARHGVSVAHPARSRSLWR